MNFGAFRRFLGVILVLSARFDKTMLDKKFRTILREGYFREFFLLFFFFFLCHSTSLFLVMICRARLFKNVLVKYFILMLDALKEAGKSIYILQNRHHRWIIRASITRVT